MSGAKRVLVVDDHPDQVGFLLAELQSAGFEVRIAANGRQALELQHEHAADVVITDIFMPDMDGMEVIDRVHSEFPHTRIVAMSSRAAGMLDYLKAARLVGADGVLTKPFTIAEVLRLLRALTADPPARSSELTFPASDPIAVTPVKEVDHDD